LSDRQGFGGFKGLDIKCGGYVVAPPSVHPSGKSYEWADGSAHIPTIAPAILVEFAQGKRRVAEAPTATGDIEEGSRNTTLFRIASRLRAQGMSEEAILAALQVENRDKCVPPLDADEVAAIAHSVTRYEAHTSEPFSDLGNARRLVHLAGGNFRYEPTLGTWFHFDGRRWKRDVDGAIERLAKKVADQLLSAAQSVDDPDRRKSFVSFATKSQNSARIRGMIELARTEQAVSIDFSEFDAQPHLLNVANGTIDLRTGALRPHAREDLLSQMVDVPFDAEATCPTFANFMSSIFSQDAELVAYMQSAIGYAASGETSEQCFFLLHGDGSNGKSSLLNILRSTLGSYAKHTPTETLVAKSNGSSSSNDLARLAGARVVTVSEANADQRLAEGLLKQVTGDEPIVARFLFKEFIEFQPVFKIFLATNYLPQINGNDSAMLRRIRTVPFNRSFGPDEQDHALPQKLAAEQPGILAWIVEGARRWYSDGLKTPAAIISANEAYRAEMDSVGAYIADNCEADPKALIAASALYASYRLYMASKGQSPVSSTMFGRALTQRGISPEKNGTMYRRGIKFRSMLLVGGQS